MMVPWMIVPSQMLAGGPEGERRGSTIFEFDGDRFVRAFH